MHVHSPIFQGQLIEKKIEPITLIVWVLRRVEKITKKGKKNVKIIFCFTNMIWANLGFFYTDRPFYALYIYPIKKIL